MHSSCKSRISMIHITMRNGNAYEILNHEITQENYMGK